MLRKSIVSENGQFAKCACPFFVCVRQCILARFNFTIVWPWEGSQMGYLLVHTGEKGILSVKEKFISDF